MRALPDLREHRGTIVLGLLLGLSLNLVFLFLVNIPRGQRLQSADQKVQELSQQLRKRTRQIEELAQAVDLARDREQTLGLFFDDWLADKSKRMIAIQREIREIALRHKIDLETIGYSRQPVAEGDDMVRFGVNFPLQGSYAALRALIRDIEHSKNFLSIDGVDLGGAREGGVLLSLNIRVSTLFRDPDLLREYGQEDGP